jgi:pimeloyl-ACP methyl ester carboxylesterase
MKKASDPLLPAPTMKRLQGDNVKINAAFWEGGEKTILCIHGVTANCISWDMMARILTPEYTVIAVDLRGRGQSDKPDKGYSPEQHARDIRCIMDDLDLEKTIVMGHSLGAMVSLIFSTRYPERVEKLILMDGGANLTGEHFDRVAVAIKPAFDRLTETFDSVESYMDQMKKTPYIHPWLPNIEAYHRYEIEPAPDGGVQTNIDLAHIIEDVTNVSKVNCEALWSQLQCPVLILRAPNGLISKDDLLLPEAGCPENGGSDT